jgi:endoglucanase
MKFFTLAVLYVFLLLPAFAAEWKDTQAVRDNILCLRFDDLVSIDWGKLGGGGHDDNLVTAPLDLTLASATGSYQVSGNTITKVGRKTRPHTFARTPKGMAHALEDRIYLILDHPLKPGESVTITVPKELVTSGPDTMTFTFDPAKSRSDAVQVNEIAYIPDLAKFGYVSSWLGDLGAQTFTEGTPFHVLDAQTLQPVFSGQLKLRKAADQTDSGQADVGNYYHANLYECDFTGLTTPGKYVLSVDGIGCSLPFDISADGYRQAYITALRGLYHQRCGTALTQPYTEWTHPVCHDEPLQQTDHRYMDVPFSDGPPPDAPPWKVTGEIRKDVEGGWHDAGDWDREKAHADIPSYLLLAYELTPDHYADKEANIPESGNGIPDIVDEARWGVDYYKRIQRPNGGVGVGMFESRWPNEGEVAWTDTLKKYMYAEEPLCTFKQAAAAAHMAITLQKLGRDDDAKPYLDSAERAWAWANDPANLRPGDADKCRDDRLHAAAALYRATRDPKFQDAFKKDLAVHTQYDPLFQWPNLDQTMGVWTFALAEDDLPGLDKDLRDTLRKAAIHYATFDGLDTSAKRGDRRGFDWYRPFQWGLGVQTNNLALMVAHKLSGDKKFLDVMVANCDLTLGNNPLDMTWVTGLGAKHPTQVMQINYWYDPKGVNPGITIMGPTAYDPKIPPAKGEWNVNYAWQFAYPDASQWPPLELWFEDRYCAQTNEFVVANEALLAASLGYLCAPAHP